MNLPEFSIKRPVTAVMIFAALMLLGLISLQRLPQELFPPVTYPRLTISTTYRNAAPEEIENLVTKPLEEVVGTVSGLKRITSISREGLSLITLEFAWNANMDFASLNVREKIDLIKERLPREAEDPVIMKFNPYELPVIILSATQPDVDEDKNTDYQQAELLSISKKYIKDEIEKVTGVAYCSITGGVEREILVELDQGRLYASNISILETVDAIRRANLNYPAGTIKGDFYEYLIRTMGEFEKVSDLNDVPVIVDEIQSYQDVLSVKSKESKQRRLIFLSDIGEVTDGYKERTSYSRYNGKSNVSISVFKQSGANTVEVAGNINRALGKIREELPKNIFVKVIYDQSLFIKSSIGDVGNAAVLGGILAFLVLLFFLQNYRSSLIVVVSIPISILVVFSLMYLRGISVNIISLGGLALGIGMLVDNSIVVIENIYRHQREDENIKSAAIKGSNEVAGAITSSTLTTVAVFIPMVFIIGIAGQLFKELAFTVTFSLLASLLVAMMLIPLLCTGQRSSEVKSGKLGLFAHFFKRVEDFYARLLSLFLSRKKRNVMLILFVFVISLAFFIFLDKEFMPKVDEGQFIIKIDMPSGTLLEVTNEAAGEIEELLIKNESVENVTVNVGSSESEKIGENLTAYQAEILIDLVKKRKFSTDEFIGQIKGDIENLNLKASTIEYLVRSSILQGSSKEQAPITIEVKGEDLGILSFLAEETEEIIEKIPGIYGVKNSMMETSPETKVSVIKDRALLYNLSVADIARIVQVALRGYIATKFKEEGEEIDIRVRLKEEDREDFSRLNRLVIHTPLDIDIPLTEVAYLTQGKGPTSIKRLDRERTVIVSANLAKRRLSKVIAEVNKKLREIEVPPGYRISLGGENEEMQESFASLRFALILSIVLIYMIMAAQFESLWQPFIIMFTVPLSIIGVVLALFLTNTSINVIVLLGIIVLGGIVVNNGIVLISYINVLIREQKMDIYRAVIEASRVRLRPIVMTALTTILALTPLGLNIGKGGGLQSPMAIAVMGGLFVSTFLTLLVVPSLYLIFSEMKMFQKDNIKG